MLKKLSQKPYVAPDIDASLRICPEMLVCTSPTGLNDIEEEPLTPSWLDE